MKKIVPIVINGECWVWTGATQHPGYGRTKIGRKSHLSHRVVFQAIHGTVPAELDICHTCDNPPCCNPDHLFLGTRSENMVDCKNKGRLFIRAKLTREKVDEIRRLYTTTKTSHQKLANLFGVGRRAITYILAGETWAT
jgi:hypothetical protein